jgi:ABC-type nitrate/sulfonate/bicarbonate transport system substrate-binding protein
MERTRVSLTSTRNRRLALLVLLLPLVSLASLVVPRTSQAAGSRVDVVVPDRTNLQFLAFWVARGAGYFDGEGLEVHVSSPESPALAQSTFQGGDAPFAVLPAPDFERLIAEQYPFELVANLLANDPIDLVVRGDVARARGIDASQPIAERLRRLKGATIGVAPNPRTRLDALFRSQGLDAATFVRVEVVRGEEQNGAFTRGEVDALYAHTPYLERALLDEGGVVVVDQAGGEVPALANRQIHALVVKRAFAASQPRVVDGMVRGIARAEALIHADPQAATDAILRTLTRYDAAHVARLVALYSAAVPVGPVVSTKLILRELAYYPANGTAPDLAGIELARFVRGQGGDRSGRRGSPVPVLLGLLSLLVALVVVLTDHAKSAAESTKDTSV